MTSTEYKNLSRVDREHWFYCGKREIVRHWINRFTQLGPDDLLIDAGMGTGTWLVEMSAHCRVMGIDDHEESLALATPRVNAVGGRVLKASLTQVESRQPVPKWLRLWTFWSTSMTMPKPSKK